MKTYYMPVRGLTTACGHPALVEVTPWNTFSGEIKCETCNTATKSAPDIIRNRIRQLIRPRRKLEVSLNTGRRSKP